MDIDVLLKNAEQGFNSLDINNKYKQSALENLKEWLFNDDFKDYLPQISHLINSEKWDFLLDSFYQVIPFGTGGRRGLVGVGTNRINTWTIEASAQGHSQYLIKQYGEEAKTRGIVLSFDVREYLQEGIYDKNLPNPVWGLNCKNLADSAAQVYAANGIKVYLFDGIRSTPELSFAIRHLNAVSGDMFSASHNPPSDNGKKVFDEHGGQLIPPHDQNLVDEVVNNVSEIKKLDYAVAKEKGLIEIIGAKVDIAYVQAVSELSLSKNRDLKVLYSPLHGTGITSTYLVLKDMGFDVTLDPKTSNISGKFENVIFNIPNPEVVESFNTLKAEAETNSYDLLVNSDPDADRVGVMVLHKGEWVYLNGNEIGIVLSEYAISKRKENSLSGGVIIKTLVTSSLIANIAKTNSVTCVGDLLVGYKYIGEEMNKLEREGKINDFIMGTEESHGFNAGDYIREKDSSLAAMWLCELAADLKLSGKTIVDYLNEIYAKYGYCRNYLTEIRLLGAKGVDQIAEIMTYLRTTNIVELNSSLSKFGNFEIESKKDHLDDSPYVSKTDEVSKNILVFKYKSLDKTEFIKVTIRPSGTEPKVKFYFEIIGPSFNLENIKQEQNLIEIIVKELEKAMLKLSYKSMGVDFPDRGFLLFWQLPLFDKMKYFEIEPGIEALKSEFDDALRQKKLDSLLLFLGSNPILKINNAFKEKHTIGILEYLKLN